MDLFIMPLYAKRSVTAEIVGNAALFFIFVLSDRYL